MSAGCSHTHRYAPSTLDTHTQFSCHGYWTTWSGVILVGRLRDRSVRSQSVSISFSKPPLRAALCCPLLPAHRTAAQQKLQCHRDWELLFLSRKLCNISTREHLRGDERTTRHGPPTAEVNVCRRLDPNEKVNDRDVRAAWMQFSWCFVVLDQENRFLFFYSSYINLYFFSEDKHTELWTPTYFLSYICVD